MGTPATCATCHFSAFGSVDASHDTGERLTWYLFASKSERRPDWQANQVRMQRVCQEGMRILFERARGIPGLIVPMFRKILADSESNAPIDPLGLDDILQRWELT